MPINEQEKTSRICYLCGSQQVKVTWIPLFPIWRCGNPKCQTNDLTFDYGLLIGVMTGLAGNAFISAIYANDTKSVIAGLIGFVLFFSVMWKSIAWKQQLHKQNILQTRCSAELAAKPHEDMGRNDSRKRRYAERKHDNHQ